jgi:cell fate regulator YaaT (PSP1 superfamily)
MAETCGVHDGGCSTCSFGQRLAALNEADGEVWPVVMVRFRESSRTRFFAPGDFAVQPNDWVIVETGRGEEAGKVIATPQQVRAAVFAGPLKPLQRLAEPWEVALVGRLEGEAKAALLVFREEIKRHGLPMKPIRAEYSFDGKRLTFYYSAEGRVDFRALVRDLAATLNGKVELRQLSARDEARLTGGIGSCGRELCCSTFLVDFEPVSVRMAKDQDLPLNPLRISGACGRLMCCLKYEHPLYQDFAEQAPAVGEQVDTPDGSGTVVGHNVPGEQVVVRMAADGRKHACALASVCASRKAFEARSGSDVAT